MVPGSKHVPTWSLTGVEPASFTTIRRQRRPLVSPGATLLSREGPDNRTPSWVLLFPHSTQERGSTRPSPSPSSSPALPAAPFKVTALPSWGQPRPGSVQHVHQTFHSSPRTSPAVGSSGPAWWPMPSTHQLGRVPLCLLTPLPQSGPLHRAVTYNNQDRLRTDGQNLPSHHWLREDSKPLEALTLRFRTAWEMGCVLPSLPGAL